jgi:Protein of unknown function (DUF4058)
MPSPFPGMDPYLENPMVFPGLHNRLIAALSETLQSALPPPYFAEIGERVWVEVSQRFIEPDASVFRSRPADGGAVAVVAPRGRPVVVTVPHDERREPWVEIRMAGDGDERLIAAIEILSPSNKTPGERGRDLYLRKQRELLDSSTHLVEIDLLRGGQHTTAVPLDRLSALVGPFEYHVSIHRSDRFEDFFVYPIRLPEPLPEVAIPLLPGDSEIAIDLQAVFNRAYDAGPYHRRIRYQDAKPVPALGPEHQAWADALLRVGG